jgi:enterochelin esterase-like enzyme
MSEDWKHRGIAGLSMGGYGAMALALTYPDVFSVAASHSGLLAPALGDGRFAVLRTRFDVDSLRASYPRWLWAMQEVAFGKDSVGWARSRQARGARLASSNTPARFPRRLRYGGLLLTQNRLQDAVQGRSFDHLC